MIGDMTWEGAQKENEREKARVSYKLENNDKEKCDGNVYSKKEASGKFSAVKLKLLKRPELIGKKIKNVFPNNLKFIPLSKLFEMTEGNLIWEDQIIGVKTPRRKERRGWLRLSQAHHMRRLQGGKYL